MSETATEHELADVERVANPQLPGKLRRLADMAEMQVREQMRTAAEKATFRDVDSLKAALATSREVIDAAAFVRWMANELEASPDFLNQHAPA